MFARSPIRHAGALLGGAVLHSLASSATADIINVPGDWPFIQQAINVAGGGDEIVVQPGQYVEHLDLMGKAITIRSIDPTNPIIVDLTRVVGPTGNPTVQCVSGETADTILRGLTFTHLSPAASDHGMHIEQGSPTVEYCVFLDNHASDLGGGVLVSLSNNPEFRHCTFLGNSAEQGGGAYVSLFCDSIFEDCKFQDNEASDFGGGFIARASDTTLRRCTFTGNTAPTGGGMYLWECDSSFSVEDCSFTDNHASGNGGGAFLADDNPQLTACVFELNTAEKGAGLYTYQIASEVTDCSFVGNIANTRGGGVYNNEGTPTYTDCTLADNSAEYGAGMYTSNSNPSVTLCSFTGNTASNRGGGMYNVDSSPAITDCDFAGNLGGRDGAIRNWESHPKIVRCTFLGSPDDSDYDSVGGLLWSLDTPDPPPPTGACCLGEYCIIATEAECIAAGGVYMGDGTTCDDVVCPDPCIGDLNGDGQRNQADLGLLLSVYGQSCP